MPKTFYRDVRKVLERHGFAFWKPAKGSHEKWRHPDGRQVIVPHNLYSRHTANSVFRQAGLDERI